MPTTVIASGTLAALAIALALSAPAAAQDPVAEGDMQRYCQGEASATFDINPRYLTTEPVRRNDRGAYLVDGAIPDEGIRFRCRFGARGVFAEVRELGGGGAAAAPAEPTTDTERVSFEAGASGAELVRSLTPGSSTRFVLDARDGQDLYVRVAPRGPAITYQIFNPDGTFLLDQISSDREYRGQLFQSGDHVIEVINRTQQAVDYNVIMGVE